MNRQQIYKKFVTITRFVVRNIGLISVLKTIIKAVCKFLNILFLNNAGSSLPYLRYIEDINNAEKTTLKSETSKMTSKINIVIHAFSQS